MTSASLKQAQVLTLAMLSGESESSRLAAHSSPLWALVASVAMPRVPQILMSSHGVSYTMDALPSMTTYECMRETINNRQVNERRINRQGHTCATWEGRIS